MSKRIDFHKSGLLDILTLPPRNRIRESVKKLHTAFKDVGFFQKFQEKNGEDNLLNILQQCYYEFIPRGEMVFETETQGKEFFIILEGTVGVYYRREYVDNETEEAIEKGIRRKPLINTDKEKKERFRSDYDGALKTPVSYHTKVEERDELGFIVYYRTRSMKRVALIGGGGSFGGMALSEENKNKKRGASILAEEDCHCAILDRESFLKIVGKIRTREMERKIKYFKTFPIFSTGTHDYYQLLARYSKEITLLYGQDITGLDQLVEGFYLVKSGSVKIFMKSMGEKKQNQLLSIRKSGHPMLKKQKGIAKSRREYEVAIKHKGSTVLEEYFQLRPDKRISRYRATCCTQQVQLIYFSFEGLKSLFYPFPDIKEQFIEISQAAGNYTRHYNKIFNFINLFYAKNKIKMVKTKKRRNVFNCYSQNTRTSGALRKKPVMTGGYNTLLKGSGVRVIPQANKHFNLEKRIKNSADFQSFFESQKKKAKSFNIKSYLKTLKIDETKTGANFMENFVIPDHQLSVYTKLEMISKSKRINNKKRSARKGSQIMTKIGSMTDLNLKSTRRRNKSSHQLVRMLSKNGSKRAVSKYNSARKRNVQSMYGVRKYNQSIAETRYAKKGYNNNSCRHRRRASLKRASSQFNFYKKRRAESSTKLLNIEGTALGDNGKYSRYSSNRKGTRKGSAFTTQSRSLHPSLVKL